MAIYWSTVISGDSVVPGELEVRKLKKEEKVGGEGMHGELQSFERLAEGLSSRKPLRPRPIPAIEDHRRLENERGKKTRKVSTLPVRVPTEKSVRWSHSSFL